MSWFFIALFGPFFWSLTNHLDKFLLSKHLNGIGKGALILYSTLFGLFVLPIILIINPNVLSITISNIIVLILAGIISALAIFFYLYALEIDEASVVVPFFQTIPIFGFILGYLLLNETITNLQILGSLVVLIGGVLLSIDTVRDSGFRLKKKVPILMLISSFLFALYEALFKLAAINVGFFTGSFWQYFGLFIFGLVLYCSVATYRKDFHDLLKKHTSGFFTLNILNESTTIVGNCFYNFAILLAPISLVMATASFQPLFVFVIGTIISFYVPTLIKEKISWKHLLQKSLAISLMLMGVYLMF